MNGILKNRNLNTFITTQIILYKMQSQNKFKLLALLFLGIISINADGQNPIEISVPRTASPAASASQTIGISKITVTYSRPSVKREKFGGSKFHLDGINKHLD